MPLVSVVIPTFGRPGLVTRAVASALAQTVRDIEVIVVADGDDPATAAAIGGIGDPRLRYIAHPHKKGAGAARNTGADASKGEWIAFLDDDDEWLPEKLARQLAAAPGRPAMLMTLYRVVSSFGELVRPASPYAAREPIDEWLFDRHSWMKGGEALLQTSALMFPRAMFDTLRFHETNQHEDWELGIRAVKQLGYDFITVPEPLVIYYLPTSKPSLSKNHTWQRSLEWIDGMRDVVTPRAYSGFCLTVVPQGLSGPDRALAFRTLLVAARRHGKPTARQLFAFALIWAVPHDLRRRVRARKTARAVAVAA